MTRKEKIKAIQNDIANYEWDFNFKPFHPLPDELSELIKLFNVDNTDNADFIKEVNVRSIDKIKWCIEECECGLGKDEWWINYTLNRQIKVWVKSAVEFFFSTCTKYKMSVLKDEIYR